MLDALARLADPRGLIPTIGDSDAFDVAYLSRFAEAVLGAPPPRDHAAPAGPVVSQLGSPRAVLTEFPSAGWVVARWSEGASGSAYLLFDASGRPPATHAGHSHADDLQILYHAAGGPILVDPGRFTYAPGFQPHLPLVGRALSPRGRFGLLNRLLFPRFREINRIDWRERFRRTLAHNTVSHQGRNRPGYGYPPTEASSVRLGGSAADAEAFHISAAAEWREGASSGGGAVRHERRVLGVLPEVLVVVDRLESEAAGEWTSSFHLAPGLDAILSGHGVVLEGGAAGRRLLSFALAGEGAIELAVEDDWVSPVYNEKLPSRTVRVRVKNASRAWLVAALTLDPVPGGRGPETDRYALRPLEAGDPGSALFGLPIGGGRDSSEAIVNPRGTPFRAGMLETDAVVCVVRRSGGRATSTAVDGSWLGQPGSLRVPCGPLRIGRMVLPPE
jgi:hypothetical protein